MLNERYYERVKDLLGHLKTLVEDYENRILDIPDEERQSAGSKLISEMPSPVLLDAVNSVQSLCGQWHKAFDEDSFHYKASHCKTYCVQPLGSSDVARFDNIL